MIVYYIFIGQEMCRRHLFYANLEEKRLITNHLHCQTNVLERAWYCNNAAKIHFFSQTETEFLKNLFNILAEHSATLLFPSIFGKILLILRTNTLIYMTKAWIEAMRLRTLPVSAAGVLAAIALAVGDGTFAWPQALLCLIFALLCQTASNFANEYYDYKAGRDKAGREGPRRGVTEGEIAPAAMKRATFALLGAAAICGLSLVYWGGWWLIIAGALIFLGALAYSTGPWPLSTHCLGEIAVIAFFGIVPVNLTYYVMALEWSQPVFLTSLSIGLMGANVLIVNNLRDIPDDRAVGKHTLATALGRKTVITLYAFFALCAAALMLGVWSGLGKGWISVPVLYLALSGIIVKRMSATYGRPLTKFLAITSVLMFAYAVALLLAELITVS